MQLIRSGADFPATWGKAGLTALAAAFFATPAAAMNVAAQDARLDFQFFADSDKVHVYTTGGDYALELDSTARLSLAWNRELVVVPGISAPAGSQEALDAISGASRPIASTSDPYADFTKTRNQLDTTTSWRGASAGYYVSDETDYFAQQVHGSYQHKFAGDNTILRFSSAYGWDSIEPLADADNDTPADTRTTFHSAVVATQVLTPITIFQLGAEFAQVSGLQHNPYRTINVAGAYTTELHPGERLRRNAFLKVNQYLPNRSSLKLDYKIYSDDWGISSHTIGGKLNQYVGSDVVVRYRYRYYTQTSSDFYQEEYLTALSADAYRTEDYRMGEFSAHLLGTKLTWDLTGTALPEDWFSSLRLTLAYERYFNSTNFSANIFETGLAFAF